MTLKTKLFVFITFFSICVVLYLLLPNYPGYSDSVRSFDIFSQDHGNFIFLMIFFASIAYILTELAANTFRFLKRIGWHTLKVGEILVSQGYITQEELNQALLEQNFKIGEILAHDGRITPQQRDQALKYQQKKYRKIGEILKEHGYSTKEDIRWALNKINRRLGKILRDKKLLDDYDLRCAMSLKKFRIDHGRIDTWK